MAKYGREGAMYAESVEWFSPTGEKFIGNVLMNGKVYGNVFLQKFGKAAAKKPNKV